MMAGEDKGTYNCGADKNCADKRLHYNQLEIEAATCGLCAIEQQVQH